MIFDFCATPFQLNNMIKRVTSNDDFRSLAKLLNDAFMTVVHEFGLTKENCPTNNAFITHETLRSQLNEKREFYYFVENEALAGFIAIEHSSRDKSIFYIEKVAVHPDFRHQGIGKQLMDFASNRIKELGGQKISIGLINAHVVLKKWYKYQDFEEVEVKSLSHLPFDICMMEKKVNP